MQNSTEEDHSGWENVEFCTLAAQSGLHIMLSQHLLKFLVIIYDTKQCDMQCLYCAQKLTWLA